MTFQVTEIPEPVDGLPLERAAAAIREWILQDTCDHYVRDKAPFSFNEETGACAYRSSHEGEVIACAVGRYAQSDLMVDGSTLADSNLSAADVFDYIVDDKINGNQLDVAGESFLVSLQRAHDASDSMRRLQLYKGETEADYYRCRGIEQFLTSILSSENLAFAKDPNNTPQDLMMRLLCEIADEYGVERPKLTQKAA